MSTKSPPPAARMGTMGASDALAARALISVASGCAGGGGEAASGLGADAMGGEVDDAAGDGTTEDVGVDADGGGCGG